MIRWVKIWILLMVTCSVFSQADDHRTIKVSAEAYGDSILVIWIPGNDKLWMDGVKNGYHLFKRAVGGDAIDLGEFLCMNRDDWMEKLDTTDKWEVLAAGMVYGEMEETPPGRTEDDLTYIIDKGYADGNRHTLAMVAVTHSFKAAGRMGLAFTDYDVTPGASYIYRVELSTDEKNDPLSGDIAVALDNNPRKFPEPGDVNIRNNAEGILLTWNGKYLDRDFVSYEVQRAVAGSADFETINESPIMHTVGVDTLSFLDQLAGEGEIYEYRVRGLSTFGSPGPFSLLTRIKRSRDIEISPPEFSHLSHSGDTMMLRWRHPHTNSSELEGFNIYFSAQYDGNYTLVNSGLLAATDTIFRSADPFPSGYFYIEALGKSGNRSRSPRRLLNPEDIIPPSSPRGVECRVDSVHKSIIVSWQENTEADLLGYRLFYNSKGEEDDMDIGEGVFEGNSFHIPFTADGNGELLFFRVSAVDRRYNNSQLSDYCKVQLPDNTPPAPPLIRKITHGDSIIVLEWAASPSSDVISHRIERMSEYNDRWIEIGKDHGSMEIREWKDRPGAKGKYYYRITAIDAARNETPGIIRSGHIYDRKIRPGIYNFMAVPGEQEITLNWDYNYPHEVDRFIIYRSLGNEDLSTFRIISSGSWQVAGPLPGDEWKYTFTDDSASGETIYRYAVRVIWKDGYSSPISDELKVLFPGRE